MNIKQTNILPDYKDYFSPSSVFAHLSKDELDILNFETVCKLQKRGTVIYQERSRMNGVYYVHKGIIKMYKTGINGKEKIIRFAKEGEIMGFRSVLSNEPADTTAKVLEDTVICFVSAKLFSDLIKQNNDFSNEVLKVSLKELGEANKFIIDIAQKTVRERLAEILLLLRDTFNLDEQKFLKVNLTREELANLVGTATESVIRLLSEFKSDGYIEIHGRKIKILKVDALRKFARIK